MYSKSKDRKGKRSSSSSPEPTSKGKDLNEDLRGTFSSLTPILPQIYTYIYIYILF